MSTQILEMIECFLKESGMSATSFGTRSLNDKNIVRRLRNGGGITLRNANRLTAFIQSERSKDGCAVVESDHA